MIGRFPIRINHYESCGICHKHPCHCPRQQQPTMDEVELGEFRERAAIPAPAVDERQARFALEVSEVCAGIASMLIEKNRAYGDSALNPVRVFSKCDTVEQLRVRIDDKLSRLMRGASAGEDVVADLIGYLVILRVAERRLAGAQAAE